MRLRPGCSCSRGGHNRGGCWAELQRSRALASGWRGCCGCVPGQRAAACGSAWHAQHQQGSPGTLPPHCLLLQVRDPPHPTCSTGSLSPAAALPAPRAPTRAGGPSGTGGKAAGGGIHSRPGGQGISGRGWGPGGASRAGQQSSPSAAGAPSSCGVQGTCVPAAASPASGTPSPGAGTA